MVDLLSAMVQGVLESLRSDQPGRRRLLIGFGTLLLILVVGSVLAGVVLLVLR